MMKSKKKKMKKKKLKPLAEELMVSIKDAVEGAEFIIGGGFHEYDDEVGKRE